MYYVSWDFHVKSPFASNALEPWMKLIEPWRMSLIFMISGAATALMLKHGSSMALVRSRSRFLLLPLLCGVLLIVPPQSYFEVVQKLNYQGGYIDFLVLYFKAYKGFCAPADSGRCLIMPTWNHLWFLPYLWAYTMITFFVVTTWPNCIAIVAKKLDQHAHMAAVFIAPILFIFVIRLTLAPRFPVTHALIDDWYSHTIYFTMFAIGAVFATSKLTWEKLASARWITLTIAIVCLCLHRETTKLLHRLYLPLVRDLRRFRLCKTPFESELTLSCSPHRSCFSYLHSPSNHHHYCQSVLASVSTATRYRRANTSDRSLLS
jgi:glucans biosynthesis protein C